MKTGTKQLRVRQGGSLTQAGHIHPCSILTSTKPGQIRLNRSNSAYKNKIFLATPLFPPFPPVKSSLSITPPNTLKQSKNPTKKQSKTH